MHRYLIVYHREVYTCNCLFSSMTVAFMLIFAFSSVKILHAGMAYSSAFYFTSFY